MILLAYSASWYSKEKIRFGDPGGHEIDPSITSN